MDRGYGKPGQTVDTEEIVHRQPDYSSLSNAELLTLFELLAKVEGEVSPEVTAEIERFRPLVGNGLDGTVHAAGCGALKEGL